MNLVELTNTISGYVWGWPMIILLLGTHIFLTIRLKCPQRKIFTAIRLSVKKDKDSEGDVSQFAALATSLAATIGTGNIIGVATAVSLGGPGAVLWCWLTGIFGIATKYGEGLLAIKFREKTADGRMLGGPMYALENGLKVKWLAILFAIFASVAAFGIGNTVQANAISENVSLLLHDVMLPNTARILVGFVIAALVAVVGSILAAQSLSMQTRLDLLDEIVRMEERTIEGQALDLGWVRDNRWDIAVADYLYMARSKTAYYSAAVPLVLGAISGNGDRAQVEGLRRFGLDAGLAFQIQDDLLNLVGDAEAQGKDYRSDITEGKRTLVMVWALEHTDESQRSDPDLMSRAVEIAREAGAIDYAHAYARELVAHAKEELDGLCIAEDARVVLISMADFFIERTN